MFKEGENAICHYVMSILQEKHPAVAKALPVQ